MKNYFIILIIMLVSCGSTENNLLGKWDVITVSNPSSGTEVSASSSSLFFEFKSDSTCNFIMNTSEPNPVPCHYRMNGKRLTIDAIGETEELITFSGVYKVVDDTLEIVLRDNGIQPVRFVAKKSK